MNRKLNSNLVALVAALNDNVYHDGNSLGDALGMTRSAVWKAIQKLTSYDVDIQSDKRKGYLMTSPLILLDEAKLSAGLPAQTELTIFETISSTNDYLKTKSNINNPQMCLAEQQTQGRGRLNREWVSPFGKNIYFSFRYPIAKDISELAGLSLIVSLAVLHTLKCAGIDKNLYVKWPNDIIYENKKLSGALIDVQAESHGLCHAVIGIGVNINMLTDEARRIQQPWTSMQAILGTYIDRNLIASQLMSHLLKYLQRFIENGFEDFISEWEAADCLQGRVITLKNFDNSITGKVIGINKQGHLQLLLDSGETRTFSSGEATISR